MARCSALTPPPRDAVRAWAWASAPSDPPRAPETTPAVGTPVSASSAATDSPRGEGAGISFLWAAASRRARERQPERTHTSGSVRSRGWAGSNSSAEYPGTRPSRRLRAWERSSDSDQRSRDVRSAGTEFKMLYLAVSTSCRLRGELTGSRRTDGATLGTGCAGAWTIRPRGTWTARFPRSSGTGQDDSAAGVVVSGRIPSACRDSCTAQGARNRPGLWNRYWSPRTRSAAWRTCCTPPPTMTVVTSDSRHAGSSERILSSGPISASCSISSVGTAAQASSFLPSR